MKRRDALGLMALGGIAGMTPWRVPAQEWRGLRGYIRTNWSRDPFAYGSYSHVAKGAGAAEIDALRAPVFDRLFFAGEATNPRYQSSVHAALESGWAAAGSILEGGHAQVGIIGAGMAGLTAAYRLSEAGVAVRVFEGRDRIGGRIWTDRSLGVAVDLGATWIHGPEDNPVAELADETGQPRIETEDDHVFRGGDGRRMMQLFAPGWIETMMIETAVAAPIENLNDAYYDSQDLPGEAGYAGPDVKFPGGYDGVLQGLKGGYDLLLSTPVRAVTLRDSGVVLGVADGEASFDAALVTAPLGVLKAGAISFSPALPVEKQRAIERLGVGLLDKLYLRFDAPFWDGESWIVTPENGLPRGQFNYWLNLHRYLGAPILLGLNASRAAHALAALPDDAILNRAAQTLDAAYPG